MDLLFGSTNVLQSPVFSLNQCDIFVPAASINGIDNAFLLLAIKDVKLYTLSKIDTQQSSPELC